MLYIILWICNVEVNVSVGVLSSGVIVPGRFYAQWGLKPFKRASLPVDYKYKSSNSCFLFGFNKFWNIEKMVFCLKLFWPTVRKICSSDQEKLLKFEAESQEFAKILRSLEQFILTVKGQYNFWNIMLF